MFLLLRLSVCVAKCILETHQHFCFLCFHSRRTWKLERLGCVGPTLVRWDRNDENTRLEGMAGWRNGGVKTSSRMRDCMIEPHIGLSIDCHLPRQKNKRYFATKEKPKRTSFNASRVARCGANFGIFHVF